jgi:hypothetical protein
MIERSSIPTVPARRKRFHWPSANHRQDADGIGFQPMIERSSILMLVARGKRCH